MSGLFDKPLKFWNSFIDAAAQGVIGLVDRVAPPRRLTLLETPDGRLVAFAGGANEPTGFFALDAKGALVADGGGNVVSARFTEPSAIASGRPVTTNSIGASRDLVAGIAKHIKAGSSVPDVHEAHRHALDLDTFQRGKS